MSIVSKTETDSAAMQRMRDLLVRTSRTFALSIPLLPEPTRTAVCLSYLLFRVVDTLEDAPAWKRDERTHALLDFSELACSPSVAGAERNRRVWLARSPTSDTGCHDLLEAFPLLIGSLQRISPEVRGQIFAHCRRTALGMREALVAADPSGQFRLESLRELRAYCYVVAGIVGELLTTIFVHDAPALRAVEPTLRHHQVEFGEGLQLVNVIKDEQIDRSEGRVYLPGDVSRQQVFALARDDLRHAQHYIQALERGAAPAGFVAFTTLPVRLARVALKHLEKHGPGAKVPRALVQRILHGVQRSTHSVHSASAQSGK